MALVRVHTRRGSLRVYVGEAARGMGSWGLWEELAPVQPLKGLLGPLQELELLRQWEEGQPQPSLESPLPARSGVCCVICRLPGTL